VVGLAYSSEEIKDAANDAVVLELASLFAQMRPQAVFTHSPFDKHDTHVAVCLRVVAALRSLPREARPTRVLGGEVWRGHDWLPDPDRVLVDCGPNEGLARTLLETFASQREGGKRYDRATLGRYVANAVFDTPGAADATTAAALAFDLTPLIDDATLTPTTLAAAVIERFKTDVITRLRRLSDESKTPP
jgi:LmbE family N-acetylglucosaminyl deacetylase